MKALSVEEKRLLKLAVYSVNERVLTVESVI